MNIRNIKGKKIEIINIDSAHPAYINYKHGVFFNPEKFDTQLVLRNWGSGKAGESIHGDQEAGRLALSEIKAEHFAWVMGEEAK